MPPTLFIKNSLRLSENGLGDGTVYASATSATPNQANKTFALTGLTLISDIGADADDKFNSHILYFPSSGNKYHIVDWVAATDTATTFEIPKTTDTGACEIRRTLVDNNALAGNPAHRLSDGHLYAPWKSTAGNTVEVHLENAIDNGGFESGALSPWVKTQVGGTADVTGINATAPMIGTNDLQLDRGDRTSVKVAQTIRDLKKDRVYRLLFKARHTGTFSADQFETKLVGTGLDVVLSNPSAGTINATAFRPTLTTAETWYTVDITAPKWDVVAASLELNITGTFDVFIDEIYIHQKISADSFIIFNHTVPFSLTKIAGRNCSKDRTNQTGGVDDITLTGAATVTGGSVGIVEFTAGAHPIYTIETTDLIQASEIIIGEKWTWTHNPSRPFDQESREYKEVVHRSRSGVERIIRHSKQRLIDGVYNSMTDADRLKLMADFFPHHVDVERHPFAYRLNSTDRPIFVKVNKSKFGTPRVSGIKDNWDFNFSEVI